MLLTSLVAVLVHVVGEPAQTYAKRSLKLIAVRLYFVISFRVYVVHII
jgi:hypothetical protein